MDPLKVILNTGNPKEVPIPTTYQHPHGVLWNEQPRGPVKFKNFHGPSFYNKSHVGSQGLNILFCPSLLTILHNCTTILPPYPMLLLLMSFMGLYFLVIKSAHSMFGAVRCMLLIQKYQTVKSFPAGNQSPGVKYFLGIVLLITGMSLWSWTLPQDIFTISIMWCSITH